MVADSASLEEGQDSRADEPVLRLVDVHKTYERAGWRLCPESTWRFAPARS